MLVGDGERCCVEDRTGVFECALSDPVITMGRSSRYGVSDRLCTSALKLSLAGEGVLGGVGYGDGILEDIALVRVFSCS